MTKKTKEDGFYVELGGKRIYYRPESKKSIDVEVLLLNLVLYVVILLYGFGYLSWPVFLLVFYLLAVRAFVANHDRLHANHKERLPRFLEFIAEELAVVVTPWDEPYDSVKRKHLKHHATHVHDANPGLDTRKDPHSAFEAGGFFRAFFSCLFYEEVQMGVCLRVVFTACLCIPFCKGPLCMLLDGINFWCCFLPCAWWVFHPGLCFPGWSISPLFTALAFPGSCRG